MLPPPPPSTFSFLIFSEALFNAFSNDNDVFSSFFFEYSKKKEEKTSLSLEKALNKASEKIKKEKVEGGGGGSIGGNPTMLWTGNGYHIYQPVSGLILEEYETFYEFTKYLDKDLTSMFIQFAEEYLTDYTADRLHNPTVKSCLL